MVPLCVALPSEIDLSQSMSKNLLSQLTSSLKSTNTNIREASLRATMDLIRRSHDTTALQSMAEVLIKNLKDGPINCMQS
jgi:hypothetical protein